MKVILVYCISVTGYTTALFRAECEALLRSPPLGVFRLDFRMLVRVLAGPASASPPAFWKLGRLT